MSNVPAPDESVVPAAVTAPLTELSARRLGPVRRFFLRRPVAMDVLVMALYAVPTILTSVLLPEDASPAGPPWTSRVVVAGVVLPVLGTAVLFWRRRRPVLVTATLTALGVVCLATVGATGGFEVAVALALYATATAARPGTTWMVFSAAMVALNGAAWLWESEVAQVTAGAGAQGDLVLSETGARITTSSVTVLLALLAVAVGTSVRNRRQHVAELVARTAALARDRDQQASLARAAERSRIAREMHDVVAHSISVMIALADGAAAAADRAPDRSRTAIDELSATGRSAMADMRRVLGVLGDGQAHEPQPGEVDLAAVVDRFRAAGLPLRVSGLGAPLPADPGLRLAVHRIVSEALTNVLRHAPGTAQVLLAVRSQGGTVEIEVTDRGATVPRGDPGGAGHGLIGMRERAELHGGTVEAGPWEQGWRVRAVLPAAGTEEDA